MGSSFQRQSAAYRKERLVIFKEDRLGGRVRVTVDVYPFQLSTQMVLIVKVHFCTGVAAAACRRPVQRRIRRIGNALKPGPHQQQCRKNGNNVERVLRWNFVLSTRSNVASTLLPKTATLSKQQATFFRSNRQQSCLLLRRCCCDIVASVDRALGLRGWSAVIPDDRPIRLSIIIDCLWKAKEIYNIYV